MLKTAKPSAMEKTGGFALSRYVPLRDGIVGLSNRPRVLSFRSKSERDGPNPTKEAYHPA